MASQRLVGNLGGIWNYNIVIVAIVVVTVAALD